ncbi:MAG: 30S ribosome-binding factor RbfA [Candidatus Wolfebacteria bacterium]|nr:30S ribosome-binding factor RbfA [Candidatus Wolfebacteria bacterium]
MRYRQQKLSSLIQEELGKIIARELEFSETLLTITEVAVSDDYSVATLGVSVLPSSKSKETFKKLIESQGMLRYELSKKLRNKSAPKLNFEMDRGPENAARIEKILIDDKIIK